MEAISGRKSIQGIASSPATPPPSTARSGSSPTTSGGRGKADHDGALLRRLLTPGRNPARGRTSSQRGPAAAGPAGAPMAPPASQPQAGCTPATDQSPSPAPAAPPSPAAADLLLGDGGGHGWVRVGSGRRGPAVPAITAQAQRGYKVVQVVRRRWPKPRVDGARPEEWKGEDVAG